MYAIKTSGRENKRGLGRGLSQYIPWKKCVSFFKPAQGNEKGSREGIYFGPTCIDEDLQKGSWIVGLNEEKTKKWPEKY